MKHEEKIHSRQFRVVARQLADPQTPVEAILHVKSASMLPALAERVEMLMAHPRPTEKLLRALEPLMHEKLLLVSFAEETSNPFSEFCISISAVRPSAWSKVLYLPPFYLAHTPGLFGVTTCVNEVASETCAVRQRHHPPGFKL